MKKIITICLVVIFVGGIFYIGNLNRTREKEVFYDVLIEPVEESIGIDTTIKINGKLLAKQNQIEHVAVPFSGSLLDLIVEEGTYVKEGQHLLTVRRYTTEDYQIQRLKLEDSLSYLEYQINSLKEKVRIKKLSLSNLEKSLEEDLNIIEERLAKIALDEEQQKNQMTEKEYLWEKAIVTRKEYEVAKEEFQIAMKNIEIQQMNVLKEKHDVKRSYQINKDQITTELLQLEYEQQKLLNEQEVTQLELARLDLEQNYEVSASKAGNVIFNRTLYKGGAFNAYESLIRLVNLSNYDQLYVETQLLDNEYKNIQIGDKAVIDLNNSLEEILEAKVAHKVPVAQEREGTSYFTVKLDLVKQSQLPELSLNMPVDVTIHSTVSVKEVTGKKPFEKSEYFKVPLAAIVIRNNRRAVLVYNQGLEDEPSHANLIYVDVLFSNGKVVVVQGNGLSSGSMVITQGNYNLYGGENVQIMGNNNGGTLNLNLFN